MKHIIRKIAIVGLVIALGHVSALADSPSTKTQSPETQAMMKKMQEAGTPGVQHQMLEPLVGEWKATSSWRMSPTHAPEKSTASAKRTWVLGGRFLQEQYDDANAEHPVKGIGMMGFENVTKQFTTAWFDTMSTAIWQSSGSVDATSKNFAFEGEGSCPMTGGLKKTRSELEIVSTNKNVFRMFDKTPEGKEFKALEIVYERVTG